MMSQKLGSLSVTSSDCCRIIKAALECNNTDLALSVFAAMRSSAFDQPPSHLSKLHPTPINENGSFIKRWRWPRPDLRAYTTLVIGLAASLRVSDALTIVDDVCRVGLSPVEEIASCAKCRYQYELVSGDIVNIASEEIRLARKMDIPAWKRWLGSLPITKQAIPSAVRSIVNQTPSGVARTHRFATERCHQLKYWVVTSNMICVISMLCFVTSSNSCVTSMMGSMVCKKITQAVVLCLQYVIWMQRNERMHGRLLHPQIVVKQVQQMIKIRIQHLVTDDLRTKAAPGVIRV